MPRQPELSSLCVRARVAIAVMCLEEAISQHSHAPKEWAPLLEQMWSYTSAPDLDEWQEHTAEFLPNVVLNAERYDHAGFEHVSRETFEVLKSLYLHAPLLLRRITETIFEVATLDMFGGIADNRASESLIALERLLADMASHSLEPPQLGELSRMHFTHGNGWGAPFDSKQLRRICHEVTGG